MWYLSVLGFFCFHFLSRLTRGARTRGEPLSFARVQRHSAAARRAYPTNQVSLRTVQQEHVAYNERHTWAGVARIGCSTHQLCRLFHLHLSPPPLKACCRGLKRKAVFNLGLFLYFWAARSTICISSPLLIKSLNGFSQAARHLCSQTTPVSQLVRLSLSESSQAAV
eukprot:TRINITY_DN66082_c0_g1_i1.p1 TRINITY_DN66082_c0_g1~~TRINITY_DN66082_c0_g1_i1.p1  ORF type:complete len:167 (+),score=3.82 TRINITY_DN66082_c0_g1_i1:79-579(+)